MIDEDLPHRRQRRLSGEMRLYSGQPAVKLTTAVTILMSRGGEINFLHSSAVIDALAPRYHHGYDFLSSAWKLDTSPTPNLSGSLELVAIALGNRSPIQEYVALIVRTDGI